MSVRVEIINRAEIASIRSEWIGLLPAERWAFFVHPDWCQILWDTYYPEASVRVHVAYEGTRVVGVLPICRRRMNRFGLFLPISETFGGGRGDYAVPVAGAEPREDVTRALLGSALDACGSGTLSIANMPTPTRGPGITDELLEERGVAFRKTLLPCLNIPLPETFDQAQQHFPRKLRADVRRRIRRFEENVGDLTFRVVRSRDEAFASLPHLFDMHDRRWLETGRPGTFSDPVARAYYERMVEVMWDQGLHFSTLSGGGRVVAYHLGMVSNRHLLHYKPTFDSQLNAYSPGKIHLWYLVEHAIEAGLQSIDFLQGAEGYKTEWTDEYTPTVSYTIRTAAVSPTYHWLTSGRPRVERLIGPAYNRLAARIEALRAG